MKPSKHILLVSLLTAICLIASPTFAQSESNGTEQAKRSCSPGNCHPCAKCPFDCKTSEQASPNGEMHDGAMSGYGNIPSSPEEFVAKHPRFAKAWKFLKDENFRASIEKPMTVADKQTIENAVAEIKNNIENLKALRSQFETARESGDEDQVHSLFHTGWPTIKQIGKDRKTILAIIAKYKNVNTASSELLDPVYPNPVSINAGAPATVTYHIQNEGPVNISVTDASGNIVKQITNESETAGDHTITVGPETVSKPGTYYVTVQAGGTKSTQKVAVVQ